MLRVSLLCGGIENISLSTGFEPVREYPNGFQVHRLNHSATTAVTDAMLKCIYDPWLHVMILLQVVLSSMKYHTSYSDKQLENL